MYNLYPGVGVTDRGSNGVPDYLDRRKLTDVFSEVALIGSSATTWAWTVPRTASTANT